MSNTNAQNSIKQLNHSILSFSSQAVTAFRWFAKEDFLAMMSDMSIHDIELDLNRFKALEEYEICKKIEFVIAEKKNAENVSVNLLMADASN